MTTTLNQILKNMWNSAPLSTWGENAIFKHFRDMLVYGEINFQDFKNLDVHELLSDKFVVYEFQSMTRGMYGKTLSKDRIHTAIENVKNYILNLENN